MAKGRGLIICVSVAYIILGASMAFCGAFQIILHLRYLWLDSVYAGVWVGMWMIVTGIMGIISSFNKCATYFIFVFMIFSFISTLLGLEIVSYYTYTGPDHRFSHLFLRHCGDHHRDLRIVL
ncbi:unnamed protein product [Porites lobata]|uniref:Uncharacterized protein n=1 Tax=Porites lobata TaxID=104759 RepID=A0ABN8Q223_9CNID|nr:unnamed protein product [Porites lobata]